MKGQEDSKKRRPYQRPQVEQVELRPEEAVLVGCKAFDEVQPGSDPCHIGVAACEIFGS